MNTSNCIFNPLILFISASCGSEFHNSIVLSIKLFFLGVNLMTVQLFRFSLAVSFNPSDLPVIFSFAGTFSK